MAGKFNIDFGPPVGVKEIDLHGGEGQIVIDNFTFTLHYAFLYLDRPTILMTSFDNSVAGSVAKPYLVYKSLSEGFWRLGLKHHPEGAYMKGSDYVTSTFLHLELQNLCNQAFPSMFAPPLLPDVPANPGRANLLKLYFGVTMPGIAEEFSQINSYASGRFVNEPVFNLLDLVNSHTYLDPAVSMMRGIRTTTLFTRAAPLSAFYRETAKQLLKSNSSEISLEKLLKEAIDRQGGPDAVNSEQALLLLAELVSQVLQITNTNLQELFTTEIAFMNTSNPAEGQIQLQMRVVGGLQCTSQQTGIVYNFIIGYYTINGTEFKHLVNIIPTHARVLQNGVYSSTVRAGVYIYKPFDYNEQCTFLGYDDTCGADSAYQFIGSVFQPMWPLSLLPSLGGGGAAAGGAAAGGAAAGGANMGGGGRRRRRSKKRNGKKKSRKSRK